jgi:hypothetical protein
MMNLPVEGFKTITDSVVVYDKLDAYAKKTNRSIPKAIEVLVEKAEKSMKRSVKKEEPLAQQTS